MNPHLPTYLVQPVFKEYSLPMSVTTIHLAALEFPSIIGAHFLTRMGFLVGVAAEYDQDCKITTLALADDYHVLVINLGASDGRRVPVEGSGLAILQAALCMSHSIHVGFDMDGVATSLFLDHGLRIAAAIDLESVPRSCVAPYPRGSLASIMDVLGGEQAVNTDAVVRLFSQSGPISTPVDVALRAWVALYTSKCTVECASSLSQTPCINTVLMTDQDLLVLCKLRRDADRLQSLKPTMTKNDVANDFSTVNGQLLLNCQNFSTKMRRSHTQFVRMETEIGGQEAALTGAVTRISGRTAHISIDGISEMSTVKAVYTIGREAPTSAENRRALIVLHALQGRIDLSQLPFVAMIWMSQRSRRPEGFVGHRTPLRGGSLYGRLNKWQKQAVKRSLDQSQMITVIQGPPGSGKTTVIAATVISMMNSSDQSRTIWLVAQSNIAVKNMAEKLCDCGFVDFKLLVSKEFHFDWHEHIYEKLAQNVIRTDTLADTVSGVAQQIAGSRVMLCTLSMIASSRFRQAGLTYLVPVVTVLVDEASQIELGDYIPLMVDHSTTLKKVVFIGDDKQLPPFGAESIPDLKSIFEVRHIRKTAVFLGTQYRMPAPIGAFISRHIYKGKLQTVHAPTSHSTCVFVDVDHGFEQPLGHSFWNPQEVVVVTRLASRLAEAGVSFRIITPYSAQRSKLEESLRTCRLPWENKVFNVDSFQGNEDDVILISVVRTQAVGFLSNQRRTNVMLSRCKDGMIICAKQSFIATVAKDTLMGKLANESGPDAWRSWQSAVTLQL